MSQIVCGNCLSRVDAGAGRCPYCGQSFANTNPAGALPVNTLLAGRYTLYRCVAVDGEGVSYDAIDGDTGERVLVKEYIPFTICSARAADGRVIPRAGREVLFKTTRMDFIDLYRTLAQIGQQPGLVRVLDLIEANDTAYAVRDPDTGMTLMQYLDERHIPLTHEEALELLRPVVYGVQAMHRAGLLHRGVSPDTVRITPEGAKLSGYATLGLRTAGGELKAQVADGYAAPEQYSVAEFDGKYTDIYSLGALFYVTVTGRSPLPANLRRAQDTLPTAHAILKQVPSYFSAAIAAAMRLTPEERYEDAGDLLAALTTPSAPSLAGSLTPRQWKYIGIAAAGFVVVMALSLWAILSMVPRPKQSSSSSVPQSVSANQSGSAVSSSSVPLVEKTVLVPTLKGLKYGDVAANKDYQKNFLFQPKYEYSSTVPEGEIISQSPLSGAEVEPGTVIKLVVSQGAHTAVMPAVVGHDYETAAGQLGLLEIKYTTVEKENNGAYEKGMVVDCNRAEGDIIDLDKDTVILYVAKEPTQTSSSAQGGAGVGPDGSHGNGQQGGIEGTDPVLPKDDDDD